MGGIMIVISPRVSQLADLAERSIIDLQPLGGHVKKAWAGN
jgi:hypothetical protein